MSADSQFYSPQLSTDFLELPQSEREKRELFRFWYTSHPIVGAAIDFHTDVPMSKIRLSLPKAQDKRKAKQILHFYQQMCKRLHLFQVLYDATHEYWLHGNVFVFCEDDDMAPEIPESALVDEAEEDVGTVDYAGRTERRRVKKKQLKPEKEREQIIHKIVQEKYQGWQRLQILPPEQVRLEVFQYTDKTRMDLIPSEKDRMVVLKAEQQGDAAAARIADDIPEQIKENLLNGQPIPLNTSPYEDFLCSSFVYHLAHKKSSYDDRGISILERCHLPGTEVTARRDGQVLQVAIEELDPETDEVLGGSGKWRRFDHGSRSYSGDVLRISVSKLPAPISCTPDHGMWILEDGEEKKVMADQLRPGDFVRVARVCPGQSLERIDLYDFFSHESWTYENRATGDGRSLTIVPERQGNKLVLHHSWVDENPQRSARAGLLARVSGWISSLKEEVAIVSEDFRAVFDGMGDSVYKALMKDLALAGYEAPVVTVESSRFKSKGRLFRPANVDVSKLYRKSSEQECPAYLELTRELGYIIGYYLGDGWTESRKTPTSYGPSGICYESKLTNSKMAVDSIMFILASLNIKNHITERRARIDSFNIDSDWFCRWLGRNFGHNKQDKHLPEWIDSTPEDFRLGLLSGLIDSDGWVSEYKKIPGYVDATVCMTTKALVDQLQTMAFGLGLAPSRRFKGERKVKQANGKISDAKAQHSLVFGCRDDLLKLRRGGSVKLPAELPERATSGRKHFVHDGNIYFSVKAVERSPYDGPVYSMDVEEDHSFFAGFVLTANCLRTLLFQDKLRQAQTSIASRAMTPKRIIWAEKASQVDVDDIRDQVDQALVDPDFTIIANYELHWDEIGSRDRLLDLSTEYDITNKLLFIGLRLTESVLTGESTYSGERIHLDVMNTMYLLYRETIATFVEEMLFAPVAEKKGFWEEDEAGNKVLLYPKLQFTRLALRDNTELQDFMFNLYQKGSMPISYIYELLNIDVDDAHEELLKDFLTLKDSTMNELTRELLSAVGGAFADETDAKERIAKNLGLKLQAKGTDRFGK